MFHPKNGEHLKITQHNSQINRKERGAKNLPTWEAFLVALLPEVI